MSKNDFLPEKNAWRARVISGPEEYLYAKSVDSHFLLSGTYSESTVKDTPAC